MDYVTVVESNGIALVTLDRPPVNALDQQAFSELAEAFDDLGARRDVKVAVLAAAGARAFCAGADLRDSPRRFRPDGRSEDGGPQGDPRYQVDPGLVVRECFWSIYDCSVPVIAAFGGKAIGAGVALLACCDLIVASEEASMALTEINVGLLGGVKHAQRLVGPHLAKRMLLTGEFVSAHEMYRRGALEAVVSNDELMPTALELAQTIAGKSPIAVRLAKESANRVEYLPIKDGYRLEQDYTIRVRRHADADEARLAFLERRTPDFHWE